MTNRKTHDQIEQEINKVKKLVKIGRVYSHYKNSQHTYKVIDIAIQEATGKVCIIYQTQYGKQLLFIRDLDNWLEMPEVNGKKVKRFTLIHK